MREKEKILIIYLSCIDCMLLIFVLTVCIYETHACKNQAGLSLGEDSETEYIKLVYHWMENVSSLFTIGWRIYQTGLPLDGECIKLVYRWRENVSNWFSLVGGSGTENVSCWFIIGWRFKN